MSNTAATTDEFDLWGGESGFKDDYDGLITEAFFTKDQKYNNGETLFLNLDIIADDGEEVNQIYPCGAEWDSYDNGETAEHPKDKEGRPKTFNHQSAMFGLMKHGFESGAEEELRRRGSPRNASIWRGLKFHFKVETQTFTMRDRKTGENIERTTTRTYPEKFLGVFDVETAGAGTSQGVGSESVASGTGTPEAAGTAQAATPAPAPAQPASNGSADGKTYDLTTIDPQILAKLKVQAKAKQYSDFLDAALAIDGVSMNDDLLEMLGSESFHAQLRG